MSEFEVSFQGMERAAQDEASLIRELKQIENEINQILSSPAIQFSGAASMRRSLRSNMQSITNTRDKLNVMSSALSEIVRMYQSTERDISNSNHGKQVIPDSIQQAIQKTWNRIKDISNRCGMSLSAAYSKDPVNLCNGNYVYEKVCMELNAEMEMQFRIFYNIQNDSEGSLGKGWIHTWEVSLERTEDRISMILDDYSRYIFLKENGEYRPAPGTTATLERRDGLDIVTDRNGISYIFEESGHLKRMENLMGCYIVLEYDEKGLLNRVTDRRGNFFQFLYDVRSRLKKVTDSTDREMILEWNNHGQMSAVTDPQGRRTAYHYDRHGWLTELVNGNGTSCLKNIFDDQGRTVSQQFPDGGRMTYQYLDDKRQVVVTEQNGNEIIYEHDDFLRNTRIIYSDGEEVNTYDRNDNRISATDRRGNTSYFSYDSKGNMLSFRNALSDELTFSYTEKNQISKVMLNGAVLQQSDYDERNLQIQTENANGAIDRYEYDEYGQPVVWEQADGSRIRLTYDKMGNLSSITNGAGGCTRYEYNDRNQVIKTIDGLGNETAYSYNNMDELVMVKDAAGNTQTYTYDQCGNVIRMTDVNGRESITEYNAVNKPVKVKTPDGQTITYEYDTMWNVTGITAADGGKTSYQYDKNQRLIKVTDAEGEINQMEYDPCGNLIQRTDPDGAVYKMGYDELNRPNYVCDPVGVETRAEYDALGNVTAVLYPDGSAEHYEYDLMSHMTMEQDRSGYRKYYEYDLLGNIKTISDASGILEQYSYYPGGLLETEKYADGSSKTFYYDQNENVVKVVNQDGNQWEFTYDCLGRVTSAIQDQGAREYYEYDALGNIIAVIDGNGIKTAYSYRGRDLTSVTDGLGNKTYFSYDCCGRLLRVVQSEDGHLDAGAINSFNRSQKEIRITDYRYDKKGNIIENIDPEGNRTKYTYDGNNRITSQTDADGNVTNCEYYLDGTIKSYHFADGKSVKMSYNPLKQLIQMEDWLGITRIQPDQMGRPESVTMPGDEKIAYEWGERGEQKGVIYPDGSKVSYEYDSALRLSGCKIGADTISYQYYPNGRLKEKQLPDQAKTLYQYNPAGYISEICHVKGGEVTDRLRYQYDGSNRKTRISRDRIGMEDNGVYEYQYNAVGSLVSVLKNGREEERYNYDAYGNRTFSRVGTKEASYAYNRLNQLVRMEDSEGEHKFAYDYRGNLRSEHMNGIIERDLKFNAQGFLESVRRAGKIVSYEYNGFGDQVRRSVSDRTGTLTESRYLYDITKPFNHLLNVKDGTESRNMIWDGGLLACAGNGNTQYFLNDERMSPLRILQNGRTSARMSFDSFGNILDETGDGTALLGYAGYRTDPVSGYMHVNAREYDVRNGRFVSRDPFPGMLIMPLTLNAYNYAMGDPLNRYDPTGMVVAWLAGGIVGAVVNVGTKLAGDIVTSVSTGKVQFSSWQSYVGTAAGGFTYGTTFVLSGGNTIAAGAASGAVETFATEGLSMLSGKKGYRAEDGYTWKHLVAKTAVGAATEATSGYLFKGSGKYIKIPGINKGRGSFQAVWKQVMTKASKGQIANVTLKTVGKGIVAYGGVHLLDEIAKKGWEKVKEKGKEMAVNWLTRALGGNKGNARCPAEG